MLEIYHCLENPRGQGGIATYVRSLVQYKKEWINYKIVDLSESNTCNNKGIFHVHTHYQLELLREKNLFAIFTAHNHTAYCPSGSKYFSSTSCCCERKRSKLGCLWGHVIQGCGSRKPNNIVTNFNNSFSTSALLKKSNIHTIAVSNYVRNELISNGLPPEKVSTLHNGTLLSTSTVLPLPRQVHSKNRILFLGRIVPEKGLEFLLRALQFTDKSIRLDIAGEGWARPRLEKFAQRLGLEDRVTWHGWCEGKKMDSLFQNCLALVFPSLWHEPAGLVALEAYARKRPVIATKVGGIPEYVLDGKTGLLISPNDEIELSLAITDLVNNYEKAMILGEKGYELLKQKFSIDLHLKKLVEIYSEFGH